MFGHRDWFVNTRNNPDFPARGMSFWTTFQGSGETGDNISSTESTITALDCANIRLEEVTTATQTKLVVVVGPLLTETKIGNHTYVLHSLSGEACSVVESILALVDCIDQNRTEWVCLMVEQNTMTQFAYDVSWIVLAYLNA